MIDHIRIVDVAPTLTAVVRGVVDLNELPKFVPAACGEVWAFIKAAGLPRPGRHTALYLEGRTVEVGAEISAPFVGNARIHCSQLPGGRVVTATSLGPYSGLSEAHATIRQWCFNQEHCIAATYWEIYGHWEERWSAEPRKIRTDIFYRLPG